MEPGAEAHYSLSIKYETPMSIVTHPHLPPPPPLDGPIARSPPPNPAVCHQYLFIYGLWVVSFAQKWQRVLSHALSQIFEQNRSQYKQSIFYTTGRRQSQTSRRKLSCQRNNATTTLKTGPTDRKTEPLDRAPRLRVLKYQAPIVQTLDSAIQWINHYPAEKYEGDHLRYPLVHVSSG